MNDDLDLDRLVLAPGEVLILTPAAGRTLSMAAADRLREQVPEHLRQRVVVVDRDLAQLVVEAPIWARTRAAVRLTDVVDKLESTYERERDELQRRIDSNITAGVYGDNEPPQPEQMRDSLGRAILADIQVAIVNARTALLNACKD